MNLLGKLSLLSSALALSACASLGTNVSGSFDCKAPRGSCAPTAVIDAEANRALHGTEPASGRRRSLTHAHTDRSNEQVLKVVFSGFVDPAGNLHESRTVHVAVTKPDWSAAMTGDDSPKSIARRIARSVNKPPEQKDEHPEYDKAPDGAALFPSVSDLNSPEIQSFFLPNRTEHPLTVREAIAGVHGPAIEGFDMYPPWHERTPHISREDRKLPTLEAIEAAKAAKPQETSR